MSIEPPTLTTPPPPAQAKYKSVPTCVDVTKRVSGLPKFRSGNSVPPPAIDMFTGCEFQRIPDWPRVILQISAWRNDSSDVGKIKIGPQDVFDAPSRPDADPADDGAAEDVKVGQKAKWMTPKDRDSCLLMILDENIVLRLDYKPADKPDPRSEECRGPLRELAKSFYDAVQPR